MGQSWTCGVVGWWGGGAHRSAVGAARLVVDGACEAPVGVHTCGHTHTHTHVRTCFIVMAGPVRPHHPHDDMKPPVLPAPSCSPSCPLPHPEGLLHQQRPPHRTRHNPITQTASNRLPTQTTHPTTHLTGSHLTLHTCPRSVDWFWVSGFPGLFHWARHIAPPHTQRFYFLKGLVQSLPPAPHLC